MVAHTTGELLTGDVELHVDAPDWNAHRHHVDPNYNGVILHVVMSPKGERSSRQQSGTRAPMMSLGPSAGELGGSGIHPVDNVRRMKDAARGDLEGLLDRAGDQRFYARGRGFSLGLEAGDPDQVLYVGLMEALGYAANRKPFLKLSRLVPFRELRALRHEPASTRLLALKALLVCAAGLLSFVASRVEAVEMEGMWRRLPRTGAMDADEWNHFRVRPANHPARRVAGAAYLMDRYVESGLVHGLRGDIRQGDARHLVRRLTVQPFIGPGRARELAVNVVLPCLHAWGGLRREQALQRLSLELYRGFPGLQDNEITREMKRLLSPEIDAVRTTGARRHQGLIHLYKTMLAGGHA
jgi:hypothetical protein